jgi:hypothetical protein
MLTLRRAVTFTAPGNRVTGRTLAAEALETALAQAELPRYMLPCEELQKQLGEVQAEQAKRVGIGGSHANP